MARISVVGTGYVGLVTGACFADLGNRVACIDIDAAKVAMLRRGELPIYEPQLEEIVQRNLAAGRLAFTTDYAEGLDGAEFIFIAVNTPSGPEGEADMGQAQAAAISIAEHLRGPAIIVNKSTMPIGAGDWVANILEKRVAPGVTFAVVSNPEFLREGSAVADFLAPDRVVLGANDRAAAERVAALYHPLKCPIMITDIRTAEMIKYASNAFLATKISFINEISAICERLGADVRQVAQGMGYDKRIGAAFLEAGVGYGGSCFDGNETVFVLNSPNVAAEPLAAVFDSVGAAYQGDAVQVALPADRRVLALDLATGQPTLAEITAITRRPYTGRMVTLLTSMGRTLRVTADHPVIVRTEDRCRVLPAAAIAPGDQLLALGELPPLPTATSLNLIELLRDTPLEADIHVAPSDGSFAEQYPRFARHVPPEVLRHPHEIRRHNRMPLRLYRHLTERGLLDVPAERLQLYTTKGAATKIDAVIPVDADLLRLCGYYLAEGYIAQDTGRAGAVRERVGFCFHADETEYTADVRRILQRWGLKFIERRGPGALTTVVSSRIFAWLLRDVLQCGTRSENKALPRLAFNVPPALRHELLRGAFSGDGALTPVQDGRNFMLEYATVSRRLADGMALLLQTLGIVPAMRVRWMKKSKQPAYILRVSGFHPLAALRDVFGDRRRARIDTLLAGYQRQIQQRGFQWHGPCVALPVLAVEYEDVDTTVYSLETSTGTLVGASGLVCHNCFPKDVRALEYMASVHGSHPQLLRTVMDINRDQRRVVLQKLRAVLGGLQDRTIGILGLAFKPNTDDLRDAPALEIIHLLRHEGAHIRAYDPAAMGKARALLSDVTFGRDAYETAEGCDAVVIVTEWNEFKQLDMPRLRAAMAFPLVVDARNIYEPEAMTRLGFVYAGIGRVQPVHYPADWPVPAPNGQPLPGPPRR